MPGPNERITSSSDSPPRGASTALGLGATQSSMFRHTVLASDCGVGVHVFMVLALVNTALARYST